MTVLKFVASVVVVGLMSTVAQAETKLQRIFILDMLNAEVPYLESISGPPIHVNNLNGGVVAREYRVGGCNVTAGIRGSIVRSLSLQLSPKCGFSLAAILGNSYPNTKGLTLTKFVKGGDLSPLKPSAWCVYSCGNAADPVVQFTWHGPHAVNFVDVVMDVVIAGSPALGASEKWTNFMRSRGETDDSLIAQHYLCTDMYDNEARRDFASVPIDAIQIGFDLTPDMPQVKCSR